MQLSAFANGLVSLTGCGRGGEGGGGDGGRVLDGPLVRVWPGFTKGNKGQIAQDIGGACSVGNFEVRSGLRHASESAKPEYLCVVKP